ncbi:hypothetical protein Tco_0295140 [Tanacetum coccineum]
MCTCQKNMEGYKLNDLKLKDLDSIQEMFDRAFKRVNTFEDFRTALVEGKAKRVGTELLRELKEAKCWKMTKKQQRLKSFDKEDLETLYKLVKAKYKSTRPVEDFDLVLWNDLKTMFKPHVEDVVWRNQQDYKTQKPRKPKRKDTQIPQSSDPSDNVADEAVHKELGESLVEWLPLLLVLDLDKTKTTQANEIASLKRWVKKLEKKNSLGKNASKQGRINAIDADEEITLVSVQDDADKEMFDVDALNGEEVFVAGQNENVVEEVVDAAQVSTAATTVTITTKEITLAQALKALKTSKPKVKGIVFQEPEPMKKKYLIRLDEEVALKLQAEFDEEERLAREKAEKEQEANIALIET